MPGDLEGTARKGGEVNLKKRRGRLPFVRVDHECWTDQSLKPVRPSELNLRLAGLVGIGNLVVKLKSVAAPAHPQAGGSGVNQCTAIGAALIVNEK